MNVRSGVVVVAVMELLTLISLLYYSNELHNLQSKRANLIQTEEEIRRSILNSEVMKVEGAVAQKASKKDPAAQQPARNYPSVASMAARAPSIRGNDYLYGEGAPLQSKSSAEGSSAAADRKIDDSAIAFRHNQILSAPNLNMRLLGNTTRLISQRPTQEYFHFEQDLKRVQAANLKPLEKQLTLDPDKLENLLKDKVALPAAAAAEDWEVWWHDGKVNVQKFVHRASAEAVFFSFNQDVARRLMYQGREVKRFVWNNDPWPIEWNPIPAKDAAVEKKEIFNVPAKASGSPDAAAWGLDRYKGMGSSISSSGAQAVQAKQEELQSGGKMRQVGKRPDEAAISKMSRVPREQFIGEMDVRTGGGIMSGDDISISTHLTVDRLDRLQSYFRRWAGPMVACIYIRNKLEEKELVDRFVKALDVEGRKNYHLILANARDATTYPANILRNLALETVKSTFVFLLDIDLIPDPGFYKSLQSQINVLRVMSKNHVFTIPAFQGVGAAASTETQFPVDKDDLMTLLRAAKIKPILSGKDEFWPAFSCLNYDAWYNATQSYLADYRWPCEPYLLGATSSMPFFDERFIHYGNDKAQHVLSLFYKQFKFAVLPFHFLVHWTHELSGWANQQKRNAHFGEVMELTEQFKFESGTQAGVNWHTGIRFSPGTYRVKDGKRIVWNGEAWIDESTGKPTDPLA
ncbi:hypothetical protein GUITHDRAFT_102076 [Guillardia theta CCMP2712]|uniref:Uncharacterized protein n=1 Tax=Guillardia theta (strain CCMP2712) TaxID=905079 RepID=L1JV25_GUITC|nr:hypothetical protein GUITHDRAFT_102076 [Guillardia theta CCMP2712]EKX52174.1 hypothetical protein GUITHDRAFT_102076 [Guillardia theta CCMP2712]|eukprot:XP_005839154.1 hypothetical protein GUITHDRAFT_102076 [Guillardia theta CCMP2712]